MPTPCPWPHHYTRNKKKHQFPSLSSAPTNSFFCCLISIYLKRYSVSLRRKYKSLSVSLSFFLSLPLSTTPSHTFGSCFRLFNSLSQQPLTYTRVFPLPQGASSCPKLGKRNNSENKVLDLHAASQVPYPASYMVPYALPRMVPEYNTRKIQYKTKLEQNKKQQEKFSSPPGQLSLFFSYLLNH